MKIRNVIFSFGHLPGKDPGAIANGIKEIDKIAAFKLTLESIISTIPGLSSRVVFVPWISLNDRVKFINQIPGVEKDLAIEIHFDVASDKFIINNPIYFGIYTGSNTGDEFARQLSEHINNIDKSGDNPTSWIRRHTESIRRSLLFVGGTKCPALIFEAGFVAGSISNASYALVGLINFTKDLLTLES